MNHSTRLISGCAFPHRDSKQPMAAKASRFPLVPTQPNLEKGRNNQLLQCLRIDLQTNSVRVTLENILRSDEVSEALRLQEDIVIYGLHT